MSGWWVLSVFSQRLGAAPKQEESFAVRGLRTGATVVGALYAVGQALSQVEAISRIANEIFEEYPLHYLPTAWQYAGKAAVVVRGGFGAWWLWNWSRQKPVKPKLHLADIVRRLIRAKRYHALFQDMAKKKRGVIEGELYNKIIDLNNQFTNIAHKGYADNTLTDLLSLARKTLVEIASQSKVTQGPAPDAPPAKKQKTEPLGK